jgi:hypothetical protein
VRSADGVKENDDKPIRLRIRFLYPGILSTRKEPLPLPPAAKLQT